MASPNPQSKGISLYGCYWDPVNPHGCFDDTSCGCYMSPCDYFNVPDVDCELDTGELSCTQIDTC